MNLFGCKFCTGKIDGTGTTDVACDRKNFDSLLWALVTVFQVPEQTIRFLKRILKKNKLNSSLEFSLSS